MLKPSERYVLLDRKTGEEIPADLYESKVDRQGWQKAYARTMADYLELTGHAPTKVLAYFLRKKDSNNLIIGSYDDIAEAADVSRRTVASMIKILQKKQFLRKIQNGVYMVSPELMRHGSRQKGIILFRKWADSGGQKDGTSNS